MEQSYYELLYESYTEGGDCEGFKVILVECIWIFRIRY